MRCAASISYGYNQSNAGSTDLESFAVERRGWQSRCCSRGSRMPSTCRSRNISVGEGYVSGALYYKELKTYIYTQPALYDFTGFPVTGGPSPRCARAS